jgi:hypothetical protein
MITLIIGLTGSGKTWLQTKLLNERWKRGSKIYPNYPLLFSELNEDIVRWHDLEETYHLEHGIIGIDEGQKLFDARRWASLPMGFLEKITDHRHDFLDIITTTQAFRQIDVRIRENIHQIYVCQSLLRIPRNDSVYPIIQWLRVTKKIRKVTEKEEIKFIPVKHKWYFISRYWTKKLYDTYANIRSDKFICKLKLEKRKWTAKLYSRELVNRGKARL